jgi:hypothetical protein
MPPVQQRQPAAEDPEVLKRLATLKSDTGAAEVVLADAAGSVKYVVGEARRSKRDRLVKIMTETLRSGLRLAAEVDENEPATMHYQAGKHVDVYGANIGRDAFLILLFDVLARRGRIGTVWVFTQRAIRDLKALSLLPEPNQAPPPAPASGSPAPAEVRSPALSAEAPPAESDAPPPSATEPTPVQGEDPELQAMLAQMEETLDEDVEAFWDEVMAEASDDRAGLDGLSFDEAVQRGLVPPGLGNGEE